MPLSAVCENSKTIRSLDLSTICPRYAAAMNVINVSVDSIGSRVPRSVAEALCEKYPNVFIRAAIMSRQDWRRWHGWIYTR